MKCPTCSILLVSAERDGVDIDYCPKCWGIWLDRGELNLILKRTLGQGDRPVEDAPSPAPTVDREASSSLLVAV